nr:hypothetical protein [Aliiroseovarius subalbicans]
MVVYGQSYVVYAVWLFLLGTASFALYEQNWEMVFIATGTLFASIVPAFLADRLHIRVPVSFYAGIVLFLFGTLFLGEAFDFYERFAWWDIVMHGASAMGFGLMGVIFALTLFEGDKYAAPAWAISVIAFTFALAIGTLWEVFEFAMDQAFGLNMQKSGLNDTMSDLIIDAIGAFFGAMAGFGYLKGRERWGLPGMIAEFVRRNRAMFRKSGPSD